MNENPYEAFLKIKSILQPSTINGIANNGTIETYLQIKVWLETLESVFNQEGDSEP